MHAFAVRLVEGAPVKAELVLAGVGCLAASGCIAEIHEERLFGAPHTLAVSRSETIEERHVDDATPGGECRQVTLTYPIVRDVTVRRVFADDGQTRNVALATLLGAGIAFLAYGANQSACSKTTGACPDFALVTTAEATLLALAAIPIAFIGYNAIRVQDARTFEYVTPVWKPGTPAPCNSSATMDDERRVGQEDGKPGRFWVPETFPSSRLPVNSQSSLEGPH
jgi:hypothetical protein